MQAAGDQTTQFVALRATLKPEPVMRTVFVKLYCLFQSKSVSVFFFKLLGSLGSALRIAAHECCEAPI